MGDWGGRGFGRGHFAQGSPEAFAIAFAVNSAAKFAIAKEPKRSDIFAAV